ncbi:DNA-binding protein [Candidatus Sumerlaeota bacterium]|nr:DNA-binding protein [Candidatus Sumerlaeota bacterium]
MTSITIQIEDGKAASLVEKARRFGLSPDEFVAASIEDLLSQPEAEFEAAARKVLNKNKDLYRRLA